ncbi:MAG: DNA phosphorothioation system sulfurtransferase DndC [Bacillota bacterium]|nr:DNA phosphorothioation system sulfurtransferase DndC [Bacillota bacterium]
MARHFDELRENALKDLRECYLADDMPWVIGYSGGKDSTTVLQLVYAMLMSLPNTARHKVVHVVASDTLVESPAVEEYLSYCIHLIGEGAHRDGLPLLVHRVTPAASETFWVLLLGKGYPAPNKFFRWCTSRLKISPTTKYIEARISESGEVVILLGARASESSSRAQILQAHSISGSRFRRHSTLPQAYVYAPIADWDTHHVWQMLSLFEAPWAPPGERPNRRLRGLYKDASGGECPLVLDLSTPSCGTSRFGCWTCTVVQNDESMEGLLETGGAYERMAPLLAFRNKLKAYRDDASKREKWRRNSVARPRGWIHGETPRGGVAPDDAVLGPFTLDVRKELFRELLQIQKATGYKLVRADEILLIQQHWTADYRETTQATQEIISEVYGGAPSIHLAADRNALARLCTAHGVDILLIDRLLDLERGYLSRLRRRGLFDGIDELISEWIEVSDAPTID